jgi:translocation and assembly module TamA
MAAGRATSFNHDMTSAASRPPRPTGHGVPRKGDARRRCWLLAALACLGFPLHAGAQTSEPQPREPLARGAGQPASRAAEGTSGRSTALRRRPARGKVTLEIRGVADELAQAARANLELQAFLDREVSAPQLRALVEQGERQIRLGLEPYGFYEARAEGRMARNESGWQVTYTVDAGPATTVRDSRVEVLGPASQLEPVREALQAFEPDQGEPLDHARYESSKSRIATTLQNTGFFDASLTDHRVEVTRAARSADINLAWRSGERYALGAVNFSEAQFPEAFLQRYLPWAPGAPYSVDDLLMLQQRLIEADYFSVVSVQPVIAKRSDGKVPIEATLTPAKRTIYTAGAYVSTDAGPGGRLGIQRRWINDRGHKWGAEIEYSTRVQAATTTYRIPRPGVRNRYYDFSAGYRDETTDTTRSRLQRLSATEVLDRWHGYQRTLGLRFLDGNFFVADELRSSKLLYAEGLLARKRADDLVFPSRGVSVNYVLRLAAPGLLSDSSLVQLRGDARWVRPAGSRSRLILRAAAGALDASSFESLPPELRFFAGGDRSVRGFDYQAIGERNATGGVIGGRNLAVASAEFEHFFLENWGAAAFVDAGDAFSSDFNANVGAGIGLRWKSPVGMVRLDVAVPVSTDLEDDGVRLHVVIGPDL